MPKELLGIRFDLGQTLEITVDVAAAVPARSNEEKELAAIGWRPKPRRSQANKPPGDFSLENRLGYEQFAAALFGARDMTAIAGALGPSPRHFLWHSPVFNVPGPSAGPPPNRERLCSALRAIAIVPIVAASLAEINVAQAAHIQVTTTQQGITNGQCSLQEAIYSSEFKLNVALDSTDPDHLYTTGCVPGSGSDTIELTPAVYTFDRAWDGDAHNIYGPTATPIVFSSIDIEGNGATLQWAATFSPVIGNARLFAVGTLNDPGMAGAVDPSFVGAGFRTLRDVYIRGFRVKGGDGGRGGGGGLGAGGAIYVDAGSSVIIENSTFDSNGAVGGNGGSFIAPLSSFESPAGRSNVKSAAVRPQGPTPIPGQFSAEINSIEVAMDGWRLLSAPARRARLE